ncbi:hypothetical protein HOLleu_21675 [Holothuria leucospilota]|uniref:DUF5641 domain-containing protein n=1 Tax=Holothuria leucospilota TaxID=206669 RepID=A0A9Q1BY65_HOLLE|nr:hypothetical protein HOLleu_21675 [Holothuria leucospilota]
MASSTRVQELVKHFWGRWVKEWLPTLNRRNKWKVPHKDLSVGDVVLTIEKDLQRGKWPLGRVVEVYPGPDGYVRVAKVRTVKGDVVRGITKLCPLEVLD